MSRLGQSTEGKKPSEKPASAGGKRVVVVKKADGQNRNNFGDKEPRDFNRDSARDNNRNVKYTDNSDDGMNYNPFAAFFNK